MKPELTAELARELFDFDAASGHLIRRVSVAGNARAGSVAGNSNGRYLQVMVNGKQYLAHRVIWLHQFGRWPNPYIDHINNDGLDNRLCNLREATHAENHQNAAARRNNKAGLLGVHWDKRREKWKAQITLAGHNRFLGRFATADEAFAAYKAAKSRLHTFNPTVRP